MFRFSTNLHAPKCQLLLDIPDGGHAIALKADTAASAYAIYRVSTGLKVGVFLSDEGRPPRNASRLAAAPMRVSWRVWMLLLCRAVLGRASCTVVCWTLIGLACTTSKAASCMQTCCVNTAVRGSSIQGLIIYMHRYVHTYRCMV
jgi:hypothetical protein